MLLLVSQSRQHKKKDDGESGGQDSYATKCLQTRPGLGVAPNPMQKL